MDTIKIKKGDTLMIAHRGLSGIERENSNFAFVAAGNRSYYGIETDVHRTSDGQFVIIHDDNTERVSGINLCVEETDFLSLREINLLDSDGTNTRTDIKIPTLAEYIAICRRYEKICVLELKNHMSREDVNRIIDIISESGYLDNVIFISFDLENLICVRESLPEQRIQYLFCDFTDDVMQAIKKYKLDVDVLHTSLDENRVIELHKEGIKVNCWTVNDHSDAERLTSWNVDFITTNILE